MGRDICWRRVSETLFHVSVRVNRAVSDVVLSVIKVLMGLRPARENKMQFSHFALETNSSELKKLLSEPFE